MKTFFVPQFCYREKTNSREFISLYNKKGIRNKRD